MSFIKRAAILTFIVYTGLVSTVRSLLAAGDDSGKASSSNGDNVSTVFTDSKLNSGISSSSTDNADADSISLYRLPSATNRSYLVGLRATEKGSNVCLGVLVKPQVVLSANCHMMVNNKEKASGKVKETKRSYNMLVASIGNRYPQDNVYGENIKIASWVRHPAYRAKTYRYNLIVFYLAAESSMTPIRLVNTAITDLLTEGSPAVMMGWPDLDENPFLTLMDATFYGQTPCASILTAEHNLGLDDSNLCVMPKKERHKCGLSRGTPLIVIQQGQEVLAGLLNFNFGCGHPEMPIMFSRMEGRQFNWVYYAANQPWEPSWPDNPTFLW